MDRDERDIAEGFFQAKDGIVSKARKLKTPIAVFITVIVVATLILGGQRIYRWFTEDRTVISNASIREEVVATEVLKASEYRFTQILFLNDAGNPIGLYNPITSKLYVATIDGTIPVYVDLQDAKQTVDRDLEGNPIKVSYELSHSYAGEVSLDETTNVKYVEQNGVLGINSVSPDDVTNLRAKAQEEQIEKLRSSGYLEKAEDTAAQLITSRVQSLLGSDVKVSVSFVGDSESTYIEE